MNSNVLLFYFLRYTGNEFHAQTDLKSAVKSQSCLRIAKNNTAKYAYNKPIDCPFMK